MTQLRIRLAPESGRTIAKTRRRPRALVAALQRRLSQGLEESATHLKVNLLSGPAGSGSGGDTPVGLRSGQLRQAVTARRDRPLSGFVGVTRGPASKYAPVILGDRDVTIRPKTAKYLWIPIADNRSKRGGAKISPREARQRDRFAIFRSKRGNLVGVLKGSGGGQGQLLFALKKQVTVHGTDALRIGMQQKQDRVRELLQGAIEETG